MFLPCTCLCKSVKSLPSVDKSVLCGGLHYCANIIKVNSYIELSGTISGMTVSILIKTRRAILNYWDAAIKFASTEAEWPSMFQWMTFHKMNGFKWPAAKSYLSSIGHYQSRSSGMKGKIKILKQIQRNKSSEPTKNIPLRKKKEQIIFMSIIFHINVKYLYKYWNDIFEGNDKNMFGNTVHI